MEIISIPITVTLYPYSNANYIQTQVDDEIQFTLKYKLNGDWNDLDAVWNILQAILIMKAIMHLFHFNRNVQLFCISNF